ncbi:aminotransferase class III-fold pyridoxal phosphate-dependent enzyme, partial [Staphylococcus aureus]|nr:aminotransferase class III-fold pyridoxal phosphate-dependent enzyme [Staphylococcus aureus]
MARLDYLELPVGDRAAAKRFYAEAFGWTFTDFGPDYAATMSGDTDVGLDAAPEKVKAPSPVIRVDDLEAALALIDDNTAGFLVEPIQGEGGLRPARMEFLQGLRKACDEHGLLLVLDEGHHIGNVAIDQGAASLALDEMAKRTGRLQILIAGAYRAVDKDRLGNLLPNEAIEVASNVAKQLRAFRDHIERVWMPAPADEEPMWRAANGRLPEAWREPIEALADDTRSLYN